VWRSSLVIADAEREMTQICVRFLLSEEIAFIAQPKNNAVDMEDAKHSFLSYAAEHFPSHLRESEVAIDSELCRDALRLYNASSNVSELWFGLYWKAQYPYEIRPWLNSIQLASLTGAHVVLAKLLENIEWQKMVDTGEDENLPIIRACTQGHITCIQMLITAGADVNAQGKYYGTALEAVSAKGYEKIVEMLLNAKADVNAQGENYGTTLYAASAEGHEKIVEMLLNAKADANAQGGAYGNALYTASARGHEKIVEMLLNAKANTNAQGGAHGTALEAASANGHEKIVEMLLDAEADSNAQGGYYGDALYAASVEGHKKIVEMLLDAEGDGSAQGGYYGDALHAASARGYEKINLAMIDENEKATPLADLFSN